MVNRGLRHVGVHSADRTIQHDRSESLDLREVLTVYVVGTPSRRGVMVLQDKTSHAIRNRLLGQVDVIDVAIEQRGGGVSVHVDGTAQQLKIQSFHRYHLFC